jgi:hypothetical protein
MKNPIDIKIRRKRARLRSARRKSRILTGEPGGNSHQRRVLRRKEKRLASTQ